MIERITRWFNELRRGGVLLENSTTQENGWHFEAP